MKTQSLSDFYKEFYAIKKNVPSYRLGQHFINKFVKDEHSDSLFKGLWNMRGESVVKSRIHIILETYQWDVDNLVIVREV